MKNEFAHASHFTSVSNSYWAANISYIITNGGYGTLASPGSGRTSVIEMWGWHYGPTLADRRYGLEHSNPVGGAFQSPESERYTSILENTLTVFGGVIPVGLNHDLIDITNGAMESAGNDVFGGFTHSGIFGQMNSTIINPAQLKIPLSTVAPSGVTLSQINALFADYGF